MLSFIFKIKELRIYKHYYFVVDRSLFRLQIMAFRIHLLCACISLCILLQYDANAKTLELTEVINVWFLSHFHFLFFQKVIQNFDHRYFINWSSTISLTINATIESVIYPKRKQLFQMSCFLFEFVLPLKKRKFAESFKALLDCVYC